MLNLLGQLEPSEDVIRLATAILASQSFASPSSSSLAFLNKAFSTFASSGDATKVRLCYSFTRALAELDYPQFTSMVRPLFLKYIKIYLEFNDLDVIRECLDLLSYLITKGYLDGVKGQPIDLTGCVERLSQATEPESQAG